MFLQFSKKTEYVPVPDWHYGIEYLKDQDRGVDFREDLFVPGFFETNIKKGESIYFSAGLTEASPKELEEMFEEEVKKRNVRTNLVSCLKNAAEQFILKKENNTLIKAGYPWLNVSAREFFISLPGFSVNNHIQTQYYQSAFETILNCHKNYLSGNIPLVKGFEYPDVILWGMQCYQKLVLEGLASFQSLKETFKNSIQAYLDDSINGISKHSNGLLFLEDTDKPSTWMNSTPMGNTFMLRRGYIVEINALWYDNIRFYLEQSQEIDEFSQKLEDISWSIEDNFERIFWDSKKKILYDYIFGGHNNAQIRPNMIFAVSTRYSPLSRDVQKAILDTVTNHPFTPMGLRSLSPNDIYYKGNIDDTNDVLQQEHHQGTVWPWLLGPYLDAFRKIYKNRVKQRFTAVIHQLDEEMALHCIGTLSQCYDGDPPFSARGAISYAPNVGEVLRMYELLRKMEVL